MFKDHSIDSKILFPAAAYIEMGLAIASRHLKKVTVSLNNISYNRPCEIVPDTNMFCEIIRGDSLEFRGAKEARVSTFCHVESVTSVPLTKKSGTHIQQLHVLKVECSSQLCGVDARYKAMQELGYHGKQFQVIRKVWQNVSGKLLLASISSEERDDENFFLMHPALLDGALQMMRFVQQDINIIPSSLERVEILQEGYNAMSKRGGKIREIWVSAQPSPTKDFIAGVIYDAISSLPLVLFEKLRFGRTSPRAISSFLYESIWEPLDVLRNSTEIMTATKSIILGPGAENLPHNFVESLEVKGIYGDHYTASVDELQWDSFDMLILPLLYCNISTIQELEAVVAATLNILKVCFEKYLRSRSGPSKGDNKRKTMVLLMPPAEGPYPTTKFATITFGALYGLIRTARFEMDSFFRLQCMEVESDISVHALSSHLSAVINRDGKDLEVALINDVTYVRKLRPSSQHLTGPIKSTFSKKGELLVEPAAPAVYALSNKEVRIRVCAVPLQKSDLEYFFEGSKGKMNNKDNLLPLVEYSGEIIDILGEELVASPDGLQIGDRVVGIAPNKRNLMQSEATVPRDLLIKLPHSIEFEKAVHVPLDFLFAFNELSGLKTGSTVLFWFSSEIQYLKVQYAVFIGARVLLICPTSTLDSTRLSGVHLIESNESGYNRDNLIKEYGCVQTLVHSSHIPTESMVFVQSLLEQGGKSVCLDDTAGPTAFRGKSLEVLEKHFGDRTVISAALQKLSEFLQVGALLPSANVCFSLRGQLTSAIDLVRSDNTPKNVVLTVDAPVSRAAYLATGAIIITGGLGGLGLVTADALVESGAKCLVLVSRSGAIKYADQGLNERLTALRSTGVTISLEKCDVSNETQVSELLERTRRLHGSIHGIIHAAGDLADAMIFNQNAETLRRVWGPKASGAWYLHKHSLADNDLQLFLCFSSVASLFGIAGQSSYSAANSFLDFLVRYRVRLGLPGICPQWPAVLGVGMAAAMDPSVKLDHTHCITVR